MKLIKWICLTLVLSLVLSELTYMSEKEYKGLQKEIDKWIKEKPSVSIAQKDSEKKFISYIVKIDNKQCHVMHDFDYFDQNGDIKSFEEIFFIKKIHDCVEKM